MTVRLYDTQVQALRDFAPQDPANVTMYVCGPTVQSGPGIHHLRAALAFDLLRRWLGRRFGRVTFVRNVTDIDDKVLQNATADEPWWALAYRMEREFGQAYSAIGILAPTYEPRATGSIPQMQELIETLIARGHAYAAAGDVYFDVRSWPSYGALTHQSIDAMEPAADADARGKRDPRDFALWKGAKQGEPADAVWHSPWGPGRPGWHIECSAMSRRYLGASFDIHGGGIDLRFPHHENELAQSTAAGDAFARYWVHNGLVTVGDQKMSKSLGNHLLAADVLAERDPLVVRYALGAAHYRSTLDLTSASFDDAEAALDRIRTFQQRATRVLGTPTPLVVADLPAGTSVRLDIDRAKAEAMGVGFEHISSTLSAAMGSQYVNDFPNKGRLQQVILQADAPHRMELEDVLKLYVRNSEGGMVALSELVTAHWTEAPLQLQRYLGFPALNLSGAPASGVSTGQAMAEMERLAGKLPSGFALQWTSQSLQERESGQQAPWLLLLSMLVVFLVLAALYESWSIPLAVMLVVPLGLLGAVAAVLLRGMPNDVFFKVGMITVIGLSAKNAILIVEFARQLQQQGRGLAEAALEAARLRLRPIVMTSLAFALGVVPLMLAQGASKETQQAIGTGIFGGMFSATVLAVFFVPVFYVGVQGARQWIAQRLRRRRPMPEGTVDGTEHR